MDTEPRRMSGGDMMVIIDDMAMWLPSSTLSGEMSVALQMAQQVIAQSRRLQHELRTALDEADRTGSEGTALP